MSKELVQANIEHLRRMKKNWYQIMARHPAFQDTVFLTEIDRACNEIEHLRALPPPEPTKEAKEVALRMQQTFDVSGDKWFKIAADMILSQDAALRAMPLQDRTPSMLAVLKAVEQRLNESGTGEMGLLDTIHAVYALIKPAILAEEATKS